MISTVARVLLPLVRPATRQRGEVYLADGRLARVRCSAGEFVAEVDGSALYHVTLRRAGDHLEVACTCPFFTDRLDICKHLWAVALAADAEGLFHLPDRHVRVVPAPPMDAPGRSGPPRHAPWQQLLTAVRPPALAAAPSHAPFAGALIYLFDPERTVRAGGLLIELTTGERKPSGAWGRLHSLALARADIGRLPDARDRGILQALAGADPAYAYGGQVWDTQTGTLPVTAAATLNVTLQHDLVPRLCATGRFLLQERREAKGAAALTPIAWEPQVAEFVLQVTSLDDGSHRVDGLIRRGERMYPLTAPRFLTGTLVRGAASATSRRRRSRTSTPAGPTPGSRSCSSTGRSRCRRAPPTRCGRR